MKIIISIFKTIGYLFQIFIKISQMCFMYARQDKETREYWKASIESVAKESEYKVCNICKERKPIRKFLLPSTQRQDKIPGMLQYSMGASKLC